jgi:hypothetical protein
VHVRAGSWIYHIHLVSIAFDLLAFTFFEEDIFLIVFGCLLEASLY